MACDGVTGEGVGSEESVDFEEEITVDYLDEVSRRGVMCCASGSSSLSFSLWVTMHNIWNGLLSCFVTYFTSLVCNEQIRLLYTD